MKKRPGNHFFKTIQAATPIYFLEKKRTAKQCHRISTGEDLILTQRRNPSKCTAYAERRLAIDSS